LKRNELSIASTFSTAETKCLSREIQEFQNSFTYFFMYFLDKNLSNWRGYSTSYKHQLDIHSCKRWCILDNNDGGGGEYANFGDEIMYYYEKKIMGLL
jgi:hypothetical protein